jgi:hypothetical protein
MTPPDGASQRQHPTDPLGGPKVLDDISNDDTSTTDELINLAQWLFAENSYYANHFRAEMYRKHMELVAQLHEARQHTEHLAAANIELQERLATLTDAYATLFGDAMDLAEIRQHMPTALAMGGDPQWCAQALATMCRSA